MSGATRRRQPLQLAADPVLLWALLGGAAITAGVWATVHLAAAVDELPAPPANPVLLIVELATGRTDWPPSAAGIGTGIILAVGLLGIASRLLIGKHHNRLRGDRAARLMGTGPAIEQIAAHATRATARRLGVAGSIGLPIADTLAGVTLYQGWEDVSVDIWGPRQGKTTARVVPAIVDAPGAVFVTSNKRDVVDATRGVRNGIGHVWVFDPQGIVGEEPTWWWNPLSYVVDEINAGELSAVFFRVSAGADARTDAYFTTAAQHLLTNLLLAAALDRRALTQVYLWLTDPMSTEPAQILDEHDYPLNAAGVREIVNAPDKQRAGVYGTAQTAMNFCTNRAAMRWCTPQPGSRPHFDPTMFARSTETLYCVSKEGKASTAGLVTALTVAVAAAAEQVGERSPGGRLPVPMVLVLDEAANVCRWPELPNLYSHFGGRGIAVLTILQSWAQGVEVWGREGMAKLWGAASVKVVGSGVSGVDFLRDLSALIGDYDAHNVSVSTGSRQGPGYQHSLQRDHILDVADLAALPKGRVVVLAAGTRPALCRTRPWMHGPFAAAIGASLRRHDANPLPVQESRT
jgi:type IV secretory pathway TraG/TraD family ATPase VirD4